MTEVAVDTVLTAEIRYRERASVNISGVLNGRLNSKRRNVSESSQPSEPRKRQKRIEQARIDRLLKDSAAFQQANEIRKYVEAIRALQSRDKADSAEEFERWSQGALAQADRIDPAIGGTFLVAAQDEEDIGG
ncbi:hypothetical protein [Edaphobacter modestus]|uniref:Uncharacterized protein n=1 Tax=Edaphobacter modestus TaxID=388466 RepID=A0A4Q7YYQ6_9BACT|nr:hypothetical protein [Edaphobacter modestus]RZU42401.1 hypothetical protein BDD14_3974 [Edaphobacter modestus]